MKRWLAVYAVAFVANLVQNQFTTARDWPFGSAASSALIALVTLVLVLLFHRESEPLA